MTVALHQALFKALAKQHGSLLLIALLRALAALLSAAPYARLPQGLLPSALQVIQHLRLVNMQAAVVAAFSMNAPSCLPYT